MIDTPRTIIEFIDIRDNPENAVAHVFKEVRINGIPVLVAENGIEIEYDEKEPTTVTLRLLPTEVHFRSALPYRGL